MKKDVRYSQTTPDITRLWNSAGFFDPLTSLSQSDLVGSVTTPGYYARMRLEHPIISSIMDSRKAFLRSLTFEFAGKNGDKVTEYWAKNVKSGKPNSPQGYNFSAFFSEMMDVRDSYGFSLHEISILPTANCTYLWPVSPLEVTRFIEKREGQSLELAGIEFWTGLNYAELPAENYIHFAHDQFSNNWWGISILRPLLNRWLGYQQALKTYLELQPLERGILYAQDNAEGGTEQSAEEIDNFLIEILSGENRSIRLPVGTDLKFIQAGSSKSSTDEFLKYSDNFDNAVRSVLNQNLDSLGLASHGSRALGETLQVSDEKKFEAWIEGALNEVMASPLMRAICGLCGADPNEIEIITVGVTDSQQTIDTAGIYLAISNGVITPDQLGQKNIERIIAATGLSVEDLNLTPPAPAATTALAETPSGPSTHAVPPMVIKAASRALSAYHALPVASRPPLAARDAALFRKLTTGDALSMQSIAQLDAFLDLHKEYPLADFIAKDFRDFVDSIIGENIESEFACDSESKFSYETKFEIPQKYEHIDFTPPKGVREAAERGLEVRREKPDSQKGGTEVGVARARDLSNGKQISPDTARRMKAYFDRHEADKKGETWDEQGKGWQAWALWGGDPGQAWAEKLVRQMNAADEEE